MQSTHQCLPKPREKKETRKDKIQTKQHVTDQKQLKRAEYTTGLTRLKASRDLLFMVIPQ